MFICYNNYCIHFSFIYINRLWTKGYDTYTPNKIITVIDDSNIPTLVGGKGDGKNEKEKYDPVQWLKNGMVSNNINIATNVIEIMRMCIYLSIHDIFIEFSNKKTT